MTDKIVFKPEGSSFCFSWIVGVKTINIHPVDNEDHTVDCMSFDHHLSQTTQKRAEQVIKQWRENNGDLS